MLDDQDLKKIGNLIDARLDAKVGPIIDARVGPIIDARLKASEDRIITAVGEMLEQNVLPILDKMDVRMDDMQKTIANLPDKAYLDHKLADAKGEIVIREKKQDHKVNLLIEMQHRKRLLEDEEVRQLNAIQVFPSPPVAA